MARPKVYDPMTPKRALEIVLLTAEFEAENTDVQEWRKELSEAIKCLRSESEEIVFTSKKGQQEAPQRTVRQIMSEWRRRNPPPPPGYKTLFKFFPGIEVKQVPQPEQHPAEVLFSDVKEVPFSEWYKQVGMSQNGHKAPVSFAQMNQEHDLEQLCYQFQELARNILMSDAVSDKAAALADLAGEFARMVKGE